MKKMFLIVSIGLASALFAESTLSWVFDGYAENTAKVVSDSLSVLLIDTTVFVEAASAEIAISTKAPGLTLIVR